MSKRVVEVIKIINNDPPPADWSDIKKWLETRMTDNIVRTDFSLDGPVSEWLSFDDIVYMTLLKYMMNSWIGKYMIQIEALKSHYKSFYCNLMRKPMRKLVLEFITLYNDDRISPGMFGDIFINNLFPEYMRNNVFIGNYLTHTNNIVVIPAHGRTLDYDPPASTLFVIRNNGNYENGKNRRRVFIYHSNVIAKKDKWDESGILVLGDNEDNDIEVVSISGRERDILALDTKGRLYMITVDTLIVNEYENGDIITPRRYTTKLIDDYWDTKTSKLLPLSQLKIISIYSTHHNSYNARRPGRFFLTDTGDIYSDFFLSNHNRYAFTLIPLPSNAKKIVLFNATNEYYLIAIDEDNSCFIAMNPMVQFGPPKLKFMYIRTFETPIILATTQYIENNDTILLTTASNTMIQITLGRYNDRKTTARIVYPSTPFISESESLNANTYFSPILSFSYRCMLRMDNKTGMPLLLCRKPDAYSVSIQQPYKTLNYVHQKINLGEKESNAHILSICNFKTDVFILLSDQKLIRVGFGLDEPAEIISTSNETGKWKFECMYCGHGTDMVDPLRLLAFCSEKCCSITMK